MSKRKNKRVNTPLGYALDAAIAAADRGATSAVEVLSVEQSRAQAALAIIAAADADNPSDVKDENVLDMLLPVVTIETPRVSFTQRFADGIRIIGKGINTFFTRTWDSMKVTAKLAAHAVLTSYACFFFGLGRVTAFTVWSFRAGYEGNMKL